MFTNLGAASIEGAYTASMRVLWGAARIHHGCPSPEQRARTAHVCRSLHESIAGATFRLTTTSGGLAVLVYRNDFDLFLQDQFFITITSYINHFLNIC